MVATLAIVWLTRSRFGFGLIAIRENEEGAAVMGVNTTLYKVLAFALSRRSSARWPAASTPTGSPSSIRKAPSTSASTCKMIIMAVFGGPGTVLGPIVGAFSLSAISELLSSEVTNIAGLFFGVVVVAAVVLMPRGLADVVRGVRASRMALLRAKTSGRTGYERGCELRICSKCGTSTRRFAGLVAVNDVSFTLQPGEISA